MAEASTFNCPNCGAALTPTSSAAEIQCSYCGNTVIVPEELRQPFLEQEQALEMERSVANARKVAVGIAGGTIALPLVIIIVTFCIIGATFFFVFQMINQTFSSVAQIKPAAISAFSTSAAVPTGAPRPTSAPRLTAAPTATRLPTPLPAATPTPYTQILLKDDFTNTSSGWDRKNSSDYILDYVKGGYRVFIGKENGGQFLWTDKVFSNASVQVDVKKIGGPDDAWFGVTCRMKNGAGGYAFKVNLNGSYEIDKYTFGASGDQVSALTDGTLNPEALKTTDPNHIRAACDHTTLSLFVNEQFVSQTSDGAFISGGVGFVALTGDSGQSGVDQLYSNLVVKGP